MRQRHCLCFKCGGRVIATDGYPIIKPKYRYSINCDSCDEGVYGHSVESICNEWVSFYEENDKEHSTPITK
jgi:hypothetical protein